MQISLDYAQAQHARPIWLWGVMVLAVFISSAAFWQYTQLQGERAGLQSRLQVNNEPIKTPTSKTRPNKGVDQLREQAKQANLVLQQLGLPWAALLAQLESSASPKIALLSVRPDAAKGRLRLSGEARQLSDVLQYIDALAASGLVSDVVLEQHEVMQSDAQKPVHFALSAHWGVP